MADAEFSAGGVVVRGGECLVIVPTRRAKDGATVLALPKGHREAGESAEEAAVREVREETGIAAEVVGDLGEVRYFYQRGGRRIAKRVRFFLMAYRSGEPAGQPEEVEETRWMALAEAATALSYQGERDVVARALSGSADPG